MIGAGNYPAPFPLFIFHCHVRGSNEFRERIEFGMEWKCGGGLKR